MKTQPRGYSSRFRRSRRPARTRPVMEWLETRLAPAAGSIQGVLWNDVNSDGVQELSEPALAGRTVFLDQNQDGVLDNGEVSTTTAADGSYAFTNLVPGTYYVTQVLPAGWKQTAPATARSVVVTLTGDTTHLFTFNNLATANDTTIGPYSEAGFTFKTSVQNQLTDEFRIYGSTDTSAYAGAPALTSEWAPVTISLTRDDGAPFNANAIDLSSIWNSVYYPAVTFTGTQANGTTVQQTFNLSNKLVFQTETFSGFTNIVSLTWRFTGFDDYHEFRNVSVTTPGTSAVSGISLGSVQTTTPTAVADSFATPENTTLTVAAPGILGNDFDPNGLTLTPVVTASTTHGTLHVNADGSFTYVPSANFYGTDSFNYYVTDGTYTSTYVTDKITVSQVNQPPVAQNDSYSLVQDAPLTTGAGQTFLTMSSQTGDYIGQGKNYYFTPASSTFSAPTLAGGAYANTVEIDVNGPGSEFWWLDFRAPNQTRVTPGVYNGAVRWPFEGPNQPGLDVAGDGRGSNTLTGTFTVLQAIYDANGKVLAFAATFTQHSEGATPALTGEVAFHSSLNLQEGVLFNDTDPDGNALTAQLVTAPSHGGVVLNADGSFTYTPAPGYHGPDSFTYKANDGQLDSNVATVSLTVYGLPTVVNQSYAANENQSLTVNAAAGLLTGSSDPNALPLSAGLVAGPAHGAVTVNPDGSFTYTPASGYYGADSFTYQASDAQATSKSATVTLTIDAPPTASNVSYTVRENGTLTTAAPGVLASAGDPDGGALSAVLVAQPASGTVTLNPDGSFVYVPNPGFSGTDSFTFEASDGTLQSSAATATVQVLPPQATSTYLGWQGPNPLEYGLNFTLLATVTVNSPGTGTPTGTVTFLDGTTPVGTTTLNANGFATLPLPALAVGAHAFSVQYNGDANNAGSNSGATGTSSVETVIPDPTDISLATSPSYAIVGQPLTLTSFVVNEVNAATIPSGSVTFSDGSTVLGTALLDASGKATFATSSLALGTHAITAVYNGDTNDGTSTSRTVAQSVYLDGTNTALATSATPTVVGQSVTFTATVLGVTPAAGTPAGIVTFSDGSTVLGTAPLDANGDAAFTTSSLAPGGHTVTAVYGGDAVHATSTSPGVSQSVGQDATTTTVASSANPSIFTQSVTLTATVVVQAPGASTPAGTVTFYNGTQALGTQGVDVNGHASITLATLPPGVDAITAVYSGDANEQGSGSPAFSQTVNPEATTTTVGGPSGPSVFGQSVTFTAQVQAVAPYFGLPTGTVTFYDGTAVLGTSPLNGGYGSLTTSSLAVGSHGVTAVYGGNAGSLGSASAAVTQTVDKAATFTTLASSAAPSALSQSVTFTAAVSVVAPGSGTPTGTVTFKDGNTALATVSLVNGVATLTRSNLAQGTHSLTVVYNGDANDQGGTSSALTQTVQAATRTALTSSNLNSHLGRTVTFSVTIANVAPGAGTPTGTVAFYDGTQLLGTATLNHKGSASLKTSSLARGTHAIYAVYEGDSLHQGSQSVTITETIS